MKSLGTNLILTWVALVNIFVM